MFIIKNKILWLVISGGLVLVSLLSLIAWNLRLGIDFTGGSLLEVEFQPARPPIADIREALATAGITDPVIQPVDDAGYLMRFAAVAEESHQQILNGLNALVAEAGEDASLAELRFDSIGPVIGQELRDKSIKAVFIVLLAITIYIAWAFRRVSYPISSWKYGIIAVIALAHDVLIVLGLFVFLGRYLNVEINVAFVAAILTILGYSVNDTIVVFDRVRENLARAAGDFETIVGRSVRQTLTRSINTSLTTLLVLATIYIFGGATVKYFTLALMAGIFVGTYSSIFIASPLLVVWHNLTRRRS